MSISTKNVAEIIGCSNKTIIKYVKMFYADKVSRGRQTALTYTELQIVITAMKQARKNRYSKNWNFQNIENQIYETLLLENEERQAA